MILPPPRPTRTGILRPDTARFRSCKRWDQQASAAMDKGLEDLASTTRPREDTLPYLEDNLDELLKSLAGEHVELSSLSDDRAALVRTALTLQGHLEKASIVITTGDLSEARRAIGAAKEVGQRLLEDLAGGSHRSEEHPSELQSLMRPSYAALCLQKK